MLDTSVKTDDVEIVSMALRHICMKYFKGDIASPSVATHPGISFRRADNSRRYQFERREAEDIDHQVVSLGGVPLFALDKSPYRVTFYLGTMNRSPQMQRLYVLLKKFFAQYLTAVEVKTSEEVAICQP